MSAAEPDMKYEDGRLVGETVQDTLNYLNLIGEPDYHEAFLNLAFKPTNMVKNMTNKLYKEEGTKAPFYEARSGFIRQGKELTPWHKDVREKLEETQNPESLLEE